MKHLLYEHQSSLTEMKAEGTVVMKLAQKEHRAQEGTLRRDMRALKVELKEQELANEVMVKNLRLVGRHLHWQTLLKCGSGLARWAMMRSARQGVDWLSQAWAGWRDRANAYGHLDF